jgi:hypothetical protein
VGIHLSGDPGDPGQPSTRLGRVDGSQPGAERRLIRDGVQVLAHGALVCPRCALPLGAERRMSAGHPVKCGFCDHIGPAREFVLEDVYDTVANEIYVVARVS